MIEPLLWDKCRGFTGKYVNKTSRRDGSALVAPPTVFLAFKWSSPFSPVLDAVKRIHEEDPAAYVWLDLFDSHANISQSVPDTWWTDVFCDDVHDLGNGIKRANFPWNGKAKAYKEVTDKYVPAVRVSCVRGCMLTTFQNILPFPKGKYADVPELLAKEEEMPPGTLDLNKYKNVLPTIKTMVVLPFLEGV